MSCIYIKIKIDVMRRACGKFKLMFALLKKGYV